MTITNHLLAGSLIGLTVAQPALAIALAFASHFVMDALPHFGYAGQKGYSEVLKHRLTYVVAAFTPAALFPIITKRILKSSYSWISLNSITSLGQALTQAGVSFLGHKSHFRAWAKEALSAIVPLSDGLITP